MELLTDGMIPDWYLFPVYVAVVTPESIQKFVELCGVSKLTVQ